MDVEKFKEWLTESEKSENTIISYTRAVKLFFEQYDELTKKNMIEFKKSLIKNNTTATANLRCVAMNCYCNFAGKPECKVKTIKCPKSLSTENIIREDEYNNLLKGLANDGDVRGYCMVRFMSETGARVSELIRIQAGDVSKGYAEMWTKGRIRRIIFPKKLCSDCEEYAKEKGEGCLFRNRFGKQLTPSGVRAILRVYAKKYGIRQEAMHPHSFRHYFAICFLKKDKDITLLADLMGHAEIQTTARYTQLSKEEQIKRLDNVFA